MADSGSKSMYSGNIVSSNRGWSLFYNNLRLDGKEFLATFRFNRRWIECSLRSASA